MFTIVYVSNIIEVEATTPKTKCATDVSKSSSFHSCCFMHLSYSEIRIAKKI